MTVSQRWVVTLGVAGLLFAGESISGQKPPGSKEKEKAKARPPVAAEVRALPSPAPPDGVWLKDEEGREYFLEKLPKAHAVPIGGGTYRSRFGVTIDVLKEDAEFYYYKVYKTVRVEPTEAVEPTDAEVKAIEATYVSSVRASARFRFTAFSTGLPLRGQWRERFDVADLNGDGSPDIVHGPPRKSMGAPIIWLGDGKGQWRRWADVKFPPLPYDYGDAKAADFNGDGRLDLAFGFHLRGLAIVLAAGPGVFVPSDAGLDLDAQNPGFSSKALAVADWDRDGRLDLLALGEGPRMSQAPGRPPTASPTGVVAFLNRAVGAWERRTGPPTPVFGDALAVGDVNGDGRLDFVTGTSAMGVKSLVNLGDESGGWKPATIDAVRPGAIVRAATVADVNRDGRGDLVLGYVAYEGGEWRTGLDLLISRADATWTRTTLYAEDLKDGMAAVDAGDIDGDGSLDLAAVTSDGRLLTFRGDGAGAFTKDRAPASLFAEACSASALRLADLNGDGRADVVASFSEEPTTDPMIVGLNVKPRCPGEGGLAAWISVRPVATPAKTTPPARKR